MSKPIVVLAIVLGVVFLALTAYYLMTPADALPSFMPGHAAGVTTHHTKHAIAAFIIAVALFIFAWFRSKPAARA